MKAILLALPLVVAGCVDTRPVETLSYSEQKAVVDQVIARCVAQGVAMNSPEMKLCGEAEIAREVRLREETSIRMRAAGAHLSRTFNPPQVRCTSDGYGYQVTTVCR